MTEEEEGQKNHMILLESHTSRIHLCLGQVVLKGSAILNISHNFPSGWGIMETSLLRWFSEALSSSLQMEVGTFVSGHPATIYRC